MQDSDSDGVENARKGSNDPAQHEQLEALRWMAARFTHELNNHLGVISNSAYLIQRRADDPKLQAAAQSMLRALESLSRMSQRLQEFADRRVSNPELLTVHEWMLENAEPQAMMLGQRARLTVEPEPMALRPLRLLIDPAEFDQLLCSLLLCMRDQLGEGVQVDVTCAAFGLPAQRERTGAAHSGGGEQFELLLHARMAQRAASASRNADQWQPLDQSSLSLQWVSEVCKSLGGSAWVSDQRATGELAFSLVLVAVNIDANGSVAQAGNPPLDAQ